ncbi:hypothetical protein M1L59_06645 [Acinetobacter schindleri]|nr:hypothetical protein [Acinetobacter schindleri]MCK8640390.1 hypothetical protein [Acinetobacter schindleri]
MKLLNKFYAAMAATVTVVAVTVGVVNKTLTPPASHFKFKLPRTTIFY